MVEVRQNERNSSYLHQVDDDWPEPLEVAHPLDQSIRLIGRHHHVGSHLQSSFPEQGTGP